MTRCMASMKRYGTFVLFLCCVTVAAIQQPLTGYAAPGDIVTIAGGGVGDGGLAISAIVVPGNISTDSAGNVYIAECGSNRIRKVDASGVITTVAGIGGSGYSGDGGPATSAHLSCPRGVFVDGTGNIFIADQGNHRIRKVDTSGIITTFAGNGTGGYSGDGGAALAAQLNLPFQVSGDGFENIYIADYYNHRIRKVDPSGIITTVAGTGIQGFLGDGGTATAARLSSPVGVAVDAMGNIYIADMNNHRIRKVDAAGIITTVAGNGTAAFAGDGGSASAASLFTPLSIHVDTLSNLYIADSGNHRIRKVDTGGVISTVAGKGTYGAYSGDGGPAINANLYSPNGVATDPSGNIFIADAYNLRVRVVDSTGIINTMAGNGLANYYGDGGSATLAGLGFPTGVAMDGAGNLYIASPEGLRVRRVDVSGIITTAAGNGSQLYSGDGGPATSAGLSYPYSVASDTMGNLYIADVFGARIRKVDPVGIITTVAGNGSLGYSGDGGFAIAASLNYAFGVAVDNAGNVYIADRDNHRIRKVNSSGVITTISGNGTAGYSGDGGAALSASLNKPFGIAVDTEGSIFFSDLGNQRIRKISQTGTITTIAGNGVVGYSGDDGPATLASLNSPAGLYVDVSGQIYVADSSNQRIRKIDTSGIITTVAGNGISGFYGDNGPAISASFNYPSSVFVDNDGNLFIADSQNKRVRKVIAQVRPTGSVSINAGAVYANNPVVTLALSCVSAAGDCTEMQVSDVAGVWPNAAEAFTTVKAWTLLSGDGTKTIYVRFKDSAGTWSNMYQDSIILDTIAPIVTITSPAAGIINTAPPPLTYAVSDGSVTVELDGVVVNKVSGNTLDLLAEGPHTVRVRSTDTAGNGGVGERTFTVDTIAPTVTITSPVSGTTNDNTPLLTYAVSDGTVTVKVDGVAVNKISGNDLDVLANGLHSVRVESRDSAGNIGFAEVTFTVDAVFPIVTITSPLVGLTNNSTPLLAYAISEGVVTVKVDGVVVSKATGDMLDRLADGSRKVRVEAADSTGNIGYVEVVFTVDTLPPSTIAPKMLASGDSHTVALSSDGSIWAWGRNHKGQLGNGAVVDATVPARVAGDDEWSFVASGGNHTIALKNDGTLWSWGENFIGQLGDGTISDKYSPVRVLTDKTWISVATGYAHSVAVASDGSLWAWGGNSYGQLGDGTELYKFTPVRIGLEYSWVAVAAGHEFSLGLKSDGSLWAWGYNKDGELGDNTTINRNIPVQVSIKVPCVSIAAGVYHSMALASDGSLWGWGQNYDGQIGDGTTASKLVPTRIGEEQSWVSISAGAFHSAASKIDKTVWTWGENYSYGQLCDGTTGMYRLEPFAVGSDEEWAMIAARAFGTILMKSDSSLWSCGRNEFGELGDGTIVNKNYPVQVGKASTIFIAGGAIYSSQRPVTLSMNTTDKNGVAEMQFSSDGTTWTAPEPYTTEKNWTLEPGDGTKTVYAKFKDNAGNWSEAFSDSIILDTIAPTVSITSPAAGITDNSSPILTYTVSDGTVVVKVDGNVVNKPSGSALGPLTEGPHTVRVESTDAAGNVGLSEVAFTVDFPPTVSITSPATGYTNNTTPLLTYTVSNGTVVVKVDGVVVNKVSGNSLDPLPDGVHTLRVESTDAGGTGYAERNFTVDTVAPVVVITSPTATTITDSQPLLSYTISDGTVTVKVDGIVVNKVSGTRLDTLSNASHTVRVEARDVAGNTGFAEVTFTVNASATNFTEDFETGNLTKLPWVTSGNGVWSVKTTTKHGGLYAAEAPVSIVDNQSASLETMVTCVSGNITFWYSVSSEANYDYLRFYVDGVQKGAWSGSVGWTQATFAVTAGSHTFKWVYSKDGSVSTGSDTAWADDIVFPTSSTPPPSGNTKNEGFETGTLTYLPWITSGNGLWSVKTTTKHTGVYAAEAPVSMVDNQSASLEVTQTTASGNITFWYSVSSEANYDFLKFYVDGVLMGQWSGTVSWTQASYAVTAGSHSFKWVYSKDGSVSAGSDTAWVDDIAIPIP